MSNDKGKSTPPPQPVSRPETKQGNLSIGDNVGQKNSIPTYQAPPPPPPQKKD